MRASGALLGCAVSILVSCEARTTAPALEVASFAALLEGSVVGTYHGVGLFQTDAAAGTMRPPLFVLFSDADPRSSATGTFSFARAGGDLPAAGAYPLGIDATGRVTATFGRSTGGAFERFRATSGELVITLSSPQRIEGYFHFEGTLSCWGTAARVTCTTDPPPGSPTVRTSGTFVAVPAPSHRLPVF